MPRPLTISVNLSVRQLHDPHFLCDVERVLRESGLPPASLVLEITESIFLESTADTMETLRRLRSLGVRLAIDDFGTGYSSLGYLKQFPMDVLKIDQSFIRSLSGDGWDHDLVQGILELARVLRMETVAEGVEREEQKRVLQRLGCSLAQGYHFSRPVLPEQITAMLARSGQGAPRAAGHAAGGVGTTEPVRTSE
jgi:EAL domain-containing protein (putative c-di-GMP-specific phosphodiesterase class I)